MLQPVAVQMFRVLVTTEGAAQAGGMFPGGGDTAGGGGGYGKPLDPRAAASPSSIGAVHRQQRPVHACDFRFTILCWKAVRLYKLGVVPNHLQRCRNSDALSDFRDRNRM